MHLEMPPPSVDIYKGKVWLYEMQVTVLEARGLLATDAKTRASDPYAVLECGADKCVGLSRVALRAQRTDSGPDSQVEDEDGGQVH